MVQRIGAGLVLESYYGRVEQIENSYGELEHMRNGGRFEDYTPRVANGCEHCEENLRKLSDVVMIQLRNGQDFNIIDDFVLMYDKSFVQDWSITWAENR